MTIFLCGLNTSVGRRGAYPDSPHRSYRVSSRGSDPHTRGPDVEGGDCRTRACAVDVQPDRGRRDRARSMTSPTNHRSLETPRLTCGY